MPIVRLPSTLLDQLIVVFHTPFTNLDAVLTVERALTAVVAGGKSDSTRLIPLHLQLKLLCEVVDCVCLRLSLEYVLVDHVDALLMPRKLSLLSLQSQVGQLGGVIDGSKTCKGVRRNVPFSTLFRSIIIKDDMR